MTGAEFKAIRMRLGCTGEAFARALGYGGSAQNLKTHIWKYENGRREIPEAVACLAQMFGAYGIPEMLSDSGPITVAQLTAIFTKYGAPKRFSDSGPSTLA